MQRYLEQCCALHALVLYKTTTAGKNFCGKYFDRVGPTADLNCFRGPNNINGFGPQGRGRSKIESQGHPLDLFVIYLFSEEEVRLEDSIQDAANHSLEVCPKSQHDLAMNVFLRNLEFVAFTGRPLLGAQPVRVFYAVCECDTEQPY